MNVTACLNEYCKLRGMCLRWLWGREHPEHPWWSEFIPSGDKCDMFINGTDYKYNRPEKD